MNIRLIEPELVLLLEGLDILPEDNPLIETVGQTIYNNLQCRLRLHMAALMGHERIEEVHNMVAQLFREQVERICSECREPLLEGCRSDKITCSERCRQRRKTRIDAQMIIEHA